MNESVTLDVLLATYKADDGLLKAQVDSVVAQQGVDVNLIRHEEVALMHDAWMILVASAFGHVDFVDEPLYHYRQHACNVLGSTSVGMAHYLRRAGEGVDSFRTRLAENVREARAFVERFGESAPASAQALATLSERGWLVRRWMISRHRLFKQGWVRNLSLLLLV